MNYKDPQNNLHFIDPDFAHLLPEGCVQITEDEAEALRPKPPVPTYKDLRAQAYPSITDYIDGIVKGDTVQVQSYIDACLAVKEKYPKGTK